MVISLRISNELVAMVDEEAARRKWSRNATINHLIEYVLVDSEQEEVDVRRSSAENHDNAGVDIEREQVGRELNGVAVSFLRPAEVAEGRLREVPAVRGELVGGNGPDEESISEACPYREYDPDTGETYGCALAVHGPKVKHVRGAKL
jgi:hypothetical protein